MYEEPDDRARPVVCFDENPRHLVAEIRTPIPARPGAPARQDVEYQRHGVRRELMRSGEPKHSLHDVQITA